MEIRIEQLRRSHWEEVCAIYLEGTATGQATFESAPPTWEEWDSNHLPFARIVAVSEQRLARILGWAALSPVSKRAVYAGVTEVSVYVAKNVRGQGVGKVLLDALVQESEENGIWTLQASIFPENIASVALHETCGFREVGIRERIGKLKGVWRDTILFERRSRVAGVDASI